MKNYWNIKSIIDSWNSDNLKKGDRVKIINITHLLNKKGTIYKRSNIKDIDYEVILDDEPKAIYLVKRGEIEKI